LVGQYNFQAAGEDARKSLDQVAESVLPYFHAAAQELINEVFFKKKREKKKKDNNTYNHTCNHDVTTNFILLFSKKIIN
jgi:hypothetical protein